MVNKLKPSVVVLMGVSGAGKDSFYSFLKIALPDHVEKVSFVGPAKRRLEKKYNIPSGILDTPEGKAMVMPDLGVTYLEFLIQSYQVFQRIAPDYWVDLGYQDASDKLSLGVTPVFTDIRNPRELDVIFDLEASGYPVHLVHITRPGKVALASDRFCLEFAGLLRGIATTASQVKNSASLDDLEVAVDAFITQCLLREAQEVA